jgi:putative intracellular protease/amidase
VARKTLFAGIKPKRTHARTRRRLVAVVAFDGVVLGDLSTPCEVFGRARNADGSPSYEVRVCSAGPEVESEHVTLKVPWRLSSLKRADTVVVPGLDDPDRTMPQELLRSLSRAIDRGVRVASICTGAFILAQTGALDGLRATTHWLVARELARRFPAIDVDADVLYVDNGQLLTSAGAAAGSPGATRPWSGGGGPRRPRYSDAPRTGRGASAIHRLRAAGRRPRIIRRSAPGVDRAEPSSGTFTSCHRAPRGDEHQDFEPALSRTGGRDAGAVDRHRTGAPRAAAAGND